ncbi:hypothetical protein DDB_G0270772 [Dictyostelium discoideum AX4]|uniref:Uncharacterized protein n=1 Tax=Dictyostelium discoideum TaxID=44689 RepID=Q55C11_DICDI|nr:hypothetical protein DDB_G0270772 [Dictyostelium discoideum AX4]EAL72736.1 hypothetical protein DDB_G0270772 [Dictyostelium discoideum AX4]|eukprot:XP_646670.1 hypothetical protein DDB_G0270772 [Dictyostelium discoideum AX4]
MDNKHSYAYHKTVMKINKYLTHFPTIKWNFFSPMSVKIYQKKLFFSSQKNHYNFGVKYLKSLKMHKQFFAALGKFDNFLPFRGRFGKKKKRKKKKKKKKIKNGLAIGFIKFFCNLHSVNLKKTFFIFLIFFIFLKFFPFFFFFLSYHFYLFIY